MSVPFPIGSFGARYTPAIGRDKAAMGVIASDDVIINATNPGAGFTINEARDCPCPQSSFFKDQFRPTLRE